MASAGARTGRRNKGGVLIFTDSWNDYVCWVDVAPTWLRWRALHASITSIILVSLVGCAAEVGRGVGRHAACCHGAPGCGSACACTGCCSGCCCMTWVVLAALLFDALPASPVPGVCQACTRVRPWVASQGQRAVVCRTSAGAVSEPAADLNLSC